ncbi:hypothetical protein QP164_00240 [Sphingomonas sp. LR59]|uniref:hypothetical protein n=1 Tax=Sphingomonas sp. LR59 TaxID=3050232 RepID=UPI002FE047C1
MMMGQLSATAIQTRRSARPWTRSRRRAWLRPNDLASSSRLFAAIPSLPRAELARLTMQMIDRMDDIDGDPDLEHLRDEDEDNHDHEREQAYE